MSGPDPCCPHETQLDAAIRDLARAHGRPEAAERVARGMAPTTSEAAARAITDAAMKTVQDLAFHRATFTVPSRIAARFAHGYQEDTA